MTPARVIPLKPLVLLGLVVVLVHAVMVHALLQWVMNPNPLMQRLETATAPMRFTTRTITLPALTSSAEMPRLRDTARENGVAQSPTTRASSEAAPSLAHSQQARTAPTTPDFSTSTTAAQASPIALPNTTRIDYKVRGKVRLLSFDAKASLQWQHDDTRYEAQLTSGGLLQGPRVQTSRGLITAQGLAPQRFSDKVRSEVATHFDREKRSISFSANTPAIALQDGAQDPLSVVMQFAAMVRGAPARFAPGSSWAIQVASAREADVWHFMVEGEETLSTAAGELVTLRLNRAPQKYFDTNLTLWLAPALSYLPARLRWEQLNGDVTEWTIESP
jgi:Protein of unknown function (DUF3108)